MGENVNDRLRPVSGGESDTTCEVKVWNWIDRKIGSFFGDFKYELVLEDRPGICRALSRLFLLFVMVASLGVVAFYFFQAAPNIRVERVYLQSKNRDYAIQRLYNCSRSYGGDIDSATKKMEEAVTDLYTQFGIVAANSSEEQEILDCPCTSPTVTWTKFVSFRLLNATPPIPLLNYTELPSGGIFLLSDQSDTIDPVFLSEDSDVLTFKKFCNNYIVKVLPTKYYPSSADMDCRVIATSLLTTEAQNDTSLRTSWDNPRASYFESPSLLDQQYLYSNTLRRLYGYLRDQYSLLNIIRPFEEENVTFRSMYLTGMMDLWLHALDTFAANSSSTDVDFVMRATKTTYAKFLESIHFYPDYFAVVLYEGQTFLTVAINWTDYYNACRPFYCDVTKKSTVFYRVYTILAQVGGLANIGIVVATIILWPVIAFLFSMCFTP